MIEVAKKKLPESVSLMIGDSENCHIQINILM